MYFKFVLKINVLAFTSLSCFYLIILYLHKYHRCPGLQCSTNPRLIVQMGQLTFYLNLLLLLLMCLSFVWNGLSSANNLATVPNSWNFQPLYRSTILITLWKRSTSISLRNCQRSENTLHNVQRKCTKEKKTYTKNSFNQIQVSEKFQQKLFKKKLVFT